MAQDWIIDVLADLRQYAVRNYHMRLAEHLDDAIMVAAAEIRAADSAQIADPRVIPGRAASAAAQLRAIFGQGDEIFSGPA